MSYLLDTCIISKLRKIRLEPNGELEDFILSCSEDSLFLSALTIGEIQTGVSKLSKQKPEENKKRMVLERWLLGDLIPRFKDRILPIDEHTCAIWGEMKGEPLQQGWNLPVIDSLIAATAIQHNLIIVTENVKDFIPTGARLINPLESLKI